MVMHGSHSNRSTPHSPFQDDFFVLHVKDDFDSVLESVLKTEFLTLLSEKYKTLTNHHMTFAFNKRYIQ